ncbi:siderophore-interacting protein [Algicella marina]|uniref:Siderophore-interacting protein n=1 Tax=Algicella marina TaxID=2683284 RepID=A0A6P1T2W0_9RHOB|nr:siderophore-interacting protein [Algicella marina]QHQ36071.1 siderophore-interacting protein [Algicella marina]
MARPAKRPPRLFTVRKVLRLTPGMIRVTFTSPEIAAMAAGCEGANCKIFLPEPGQTKEAFVAQLADGPRPVVRTYTVRFIRPIDCEMDIDFVDHGDAGPASAWARRADAGDFCGFAGPGPVKVESFYADRYLVVADMSALPVAAATLEAMPRDAVGTALFEITSPADRQEIDAPDGVEQHWIVNPHADQPTGDILRKVLDWPWPEGRIQTCIAGESGMIADLRRYLLVERGLAKEDAYISGYWKVGLVEDEHQQMKREEAAAG